MHEFFIFYYRIIEFVLELNYNLTLAIRSLGQNVFGKEMSFSHLSSLSKSHVSTDTSSINIFSIDGLIKGTLTLSLLNLVFSYSFRYVIIKVFILLAPFAFLSLSLTNSSWFFRTWAKNLFSLLFIQIIVSLVLLVVFSMDFSSTDLFTKFVYIGGIYVLIKANSFVREFIGGISTNVTQAVNNFTNFKI